eukprot:2519107-Pyramimonas_sp.AAC.1
MAVAIVRTLKVLGSLVNDRNDFAREAAACVLALKWATTPLRKTAFKRDEITSIAKIQYLSALGYSRLLHNAGVWMPTKRTGTETIAFACTAAAR